MRIEHFLEKKEANHVSILKKIIHEGGKISYEELRYYLNISKASLENYLDEIRTNFNDYQGKCQLQLNGSEITLQVDNLFSIETIYSDYVRKSLKFQIIDYIYKHQEFTVVKIVRDLAISESTLFRKIKEVNAFLKEFNIKIKNGHLYGEELQIRYFYFQIYAYIMTEAELQEALLANRSHSLIDAFEKELEIKISEFSRKRVGLWVLISKKRAKSVKKIYRTMLQKMKPYRDDYLYNQVRQLVLLYSSRYSIDLEDEETMLHYIFLTTQSILSEQDFNNYELIRSRRTPTAMMDTLSRETILSYYRPIKPTIALERKITFYLSQINGILYFFDGALEIRAANSELSKVNGIWENNLDQLGLQLLETALATIQKTRIPESSLQALTLMNYNTILAIVDLSISKEVALGIDLDLDDMQREYLTQTLILKLKNIIGLTVESYQENSNYDLVVTTNKATYYSPGTEVYLISERFSKFDLFQIKSIIDGLKGQI